MKRYTTKLGDVFLVEESGPKPRVKLEVRGERNTSTQLTGEWQDCRGAVMLMDGLLIDWKDYCGDGKSQTWSAPVVSIEDL